MIRARSILSHIVSVVFIAVPAWMVVSGIIIILLDLYDMSHGIMELIAIGIYYYLIYWPLFILIAIILYFIEHELARRLRKPSSLIRIVAGMVIIAGLIIITGAGWHSVIGLVFAYILHVIVINMMYDRYIMIGEQVLDA